LAKYKAAKATTKLDSVTFSDIVNYESNDDLVSLTGDRKFMKNNQLTNKLSSNKNSSVNPHSKPQTVEESSTFKQAHVEQTQSR